MTTYEEERTETQKKIDADILERVQSGLKWLEQTHGPGWEDEIDLERLDIHLPTQCLLGQIYGNYWSLVPCVMHHRAAVSFGFDLENGVEWADRGDQLQAAWERALEPRVSR